MEELTMEKERKNNDQAFDKHKLKQKQAEVLEHCQKVLRKTSPPRMNETALNQMPSGPSLVI
jgi:hypothetical protein